MDSAVKEGIFHGGKGGQTRAFLEVTSILEGGIEIRFKGY